MATVILGLGANLDDREQALRRAVWALKSLLTGMRCSAVYESRAVLPADAPPEWDLPFLNMAVSGETNMGPISLLSEIKAIEKRLGRVPREHWGPREIDIDILAYDDSRVTEAQLVIPHAELLRRDFALVPLADIAPQWKHPDAKRTALELVDAMKSALKKTEIAIT